MLAAGVLLWAWVAATPAEKPPASTSHFDAARELYADLKYERALLLLNRALARPGAQSQERAAIYVYIGLCRFPLGDEAGARTAFREALTLDEKAALPPMTSPKVARLFERVSEELGIPSARDNRESTATARPTAAQVMPSESTPPPVAALPSSDATRPPTPAVGEEARSSPRWPAYLAAGVTAALAGTALVVGANARETERRSNEAPFASDRLTLSNQAEAQARTANILFGCAGGAAAGAVVLFVVPL